MPVDYSKYPDNWKDISSAILNRDGHQCVYCGLNSGWYVRLNNIWCPIHEECVLYFKNRDLSVFKMSLACVHLDGNEDNVNNENLVTACQWCHLKIDKAKHALSVKYGKSFLKFQSSLW